MDQTMLFNLTETELYRNIEPALLGVLDRNWADRSLLSFEKRQSYHSVMFDGSVVARVKGGKRSYLEFPMGQEIPGSVKRDNYLRVKLVSLDEASDYLQYFTASLQMVIDAIPKDFSCCSRYMECSDMVKCLNPDKDMAMRCGYRKVLMSGKVFYGKNRNVD